MAQKINQVQTGKIYSATEQLTGDVFWDGKPIYRKTFDVSPLPNTASKDVAHGIAGLNRVINLYGYGYRVSDGFNPTLPYIGDTIALSISVFVLGNNIRIIAGSNRSDMGGIITLEYTKA